VTGEREHLLRVLKRVYAPAMTLSNVVGAGVVFVFLAYLLPVTEQHHGDPNAQRTLNTVAFVAYLALSLGIGNVWGTRVARELREWLESSRPAGPVDRDAALTLPLRQLRVHVALWAAAAIVFGALNVSYSPQLAVEVMGTILLGGITTSALGYLVAERAVRPIVGVVMADSPDPPRRVVGVKARLLMAWALGTGVPLLGIGLGTVPLGHRPDALPTGAELFLVGVAVIVGALAISAAAGAVSDPVRSVADALREVGRGNFDVSVPVYDASEVGQLQSGFNAMVEGLREREQLRDLFGRQVGSDVARLALEQGVQLGGERRDVAVLFVDVIGSTAMAETLGPEEVVERLNAFFAVVIDVVTCHGGWVNKFEGDAAFCIFGAPAALDDASTNALDAARGLITRLSPLPLEAAVGVSAGPVVAGHVGAESRFEYTVIGDPVNAAARLTELAKTDPTRVLADDEAVRRSSAAEQQCWEPAGEVVLRGRTTPTRTWRPRV
jgi:adenylate cyclase